MLKPYLCLVFVMAAVVVAQAQQHGFNDSIQTIPTVEIVDSMPHIVCGPSEVRILKPIGISRISPGTIQQNQTESVDALLTYHTPVFVKNYGVGGLSTISFRGTRANHAKVYWNGLHINSPMVGQVDFATLPVTFVDHMSLRMGGASLQQNAGSLGGSISLGTLWDFSKKLNIEAVQSAGSYGNYATAAKVQGGSSNLQVGIRGFFKDADNDYRYTNGELPSKPEVRQTNNQLRQYGLAGELGYQVNTHDILLNSWYQHSNRNLPPSMISPSNNETQVDESFRNMLTYKFEKRNLQFGSTIGYIKDEITYKNGQTQVESISRYNSYQLRTEIILDINPKWVFNLNTRFELANAESSLFTGRKNYTELSVAPSFRYLIKDYLELIFLYRQNLNDGELAPPLPSLSITWRSWKDQNPIPWISVTAGISRNYHYPTLNERYASVVSNPDLKSEEGWTGEFEIQLEKKTKKGIRLNYTGRAYAMRINDWIMWKPTAISYNYWQAENLRLVHSIGTEQEGKVYFNIKGKMLSAYANYAFVHSENKKPYSSLDESVDKQLIYIPKHSLQAGIRFEYKDFYIYTEQVFYTKRFITTSNSSYLPAYNLVNVGTGYAFQFGEHELKASFKVNNILNERYQSIAYWPMPGINFNATVAYQFLKTR